MKNTNEELAGFMGSGPEFKYINLTITEGVLHLAENWSCFWLLDLISNWQTNKAVKNADFQKWKLARTVKNKFMVTCDDGNDNILCGQKVSFSDFRDDVVTLYLENKTIYLPSER